MFLRTLYLLYYTCYVIYIIIFIIVHILKIHPIQSLAWILRQLAVFIAQKTLKSFHSYIAFNREQGNSYISLKNIS